MGRRNLSAERITQILDAFEACIVEEGLEAATLQRTADHAGVNLGMLHHYIGKRNDLLKALVTRLIERTQSDLAQFRQFTPKRGRLNKFIDLFFDESEASQAENRLVSELINASIHEPVIQQLLLELNQNYADVISSEITLAYPQLSKARGDQLAFAVLSLVFGSDLLTELGFPHKNKAGVAKIAKNLILIEASV